MIGAEEIMWRDLVRRHCHCLSLISYWTPFSLSPGAEAAQRDTLERFGEKSDRMLCSRPRMCECAQPGAEHWRRGREVKQRCQRWPGSTCANIQRSAGSGRHPNIAMDLKLPGSWIKSKTSYSCLVVTGHGNPPETRFSCLEMSQFVIFLQNIKKWDWCLNKSSSPAQKTDRL